MAESPRGLGRARAPPDRYLGERAGARFTHGICDGCLGLHYGEYLAPGAG